MPYHSNNGLDDPLAFDQCLAFNGGQHSRLRSNLLDQNQFSLGKNSDPDRNGNFITRRGTEAVTDLTITVQGARYFKTPSLEELLLAGNGGVSKWDGSTLTSLSGYTPASSAQVDMAQLVNRIYFTDGVNNVHSYEGTSITDEGNGATDPPLCQFMVSHAGAIFAAGTQNADELLRSDLLDGQTWDKVNWSISVGRGDNDAITGLCPWEGYNLVVGKEHSIHVVNADPQASNASEWVVTPIEANVGCVAHRSMVMFGRDVWFLSRSGVHTIRRLTEGQNFEVTDPISSPIQDWIDRINWDHASKSCAMVWNNRYILAVPVDNSTEPNIVLVYNSLIRNWSGYWTGWTPRQFVRTMFNDQHRMVICQHDGTVKQWRDYTLIANEVDADFQDDGADIETIHLSRGMSFGDLAAEKTPRHLQVEFEKSKAQVTVEAILDGGGPLTIFKGLVDTANPGWTFPIRFPFTMPDTKPVKRAASIPGSRFYEMQVKFTSTAGKLQIRNYTASAYFTTVDTER